MSRAVERVGMPPDKATELAILRDPTLRDADLLRVVRPGKFVPYAAGSRIREEHRDEPLQGGAMSRKALEQHCIGWVRLRFGGGAPQSEA